MRIIPIANPHRRKHFEFFRAMNHPHFSVCAPVDVTAVHTRARAAGLSLTPTLVYLLAHCCNQVAPLRQRIRGAELIEHEVVHPSFAVDTQAADVFSFCEVEFTREFAEFHGRARERIAAMRAAPSFEDVPGRDDYLFMSALPWVAFTSVQHAMMFHPHDSVPRLVWGKLTCAGGRVTMPLSVQAHHAVVDGRHLGQFFGLVEAMAGDPSWASLEG